MCNKVYMKSNLIIFFRKMKLLIFLVFFVQFNVLSQEQNTMNFNDLTNILNQKFSKKIAFSVLISNNNKEVYHQNFGFSDKKNNIPVDEQTIFNIASITKSFTSIAILKLMEEGKLNLENPVTLYFENVPEDLESIRIHTLLAHKSGFDQSYPLEDIETSDKALKTILEQKLSFIPESNFKYSNINYQLLALIIEKVAETSYEEFIRKIILKPLGMTNTFFWNDEMSEKKIAPMDKKMIKKVGSRNWGWIGASGIFSTTKDLSKFWNGIYRGGFISEKSKEVIFDTYHKASSGTEIGYGFYKNPSTKWDLKEVWTRGTEDWGHNSVIRYFPEKGTAIIVTTNSDRVGKDKEPGNRVISDLIADFLFL